jgi:hypothetical protein
MVQCRQQPRYKGRSWLNRKIGLDGSFVNGPFELLLCAYTKSRALRSCRGAAGSSAAPETTRYSKLRDSH